VGEEFKKKIYIGSNFANQGDGARSWKVDTFSGKI